MLRKEARFETQLTVHAEDRSFSVPDGMLGRDDPVMHMTQTCRSAAQF